MLDKAQMTASSCAVEHHGDKMRLTIHVTNLDEYNNAYRLFHSMPGFKIDESDPRDRGSILGSRLVIELSDVFAQEASALMSRINFRRDPAIQDGTDKPLNVVNISPVLAHR
jgi:hypothetical protein